MDDISPQAFVDAAIAYQKTAAVKAAVAIEKVRVGQACSRAGPW
ncbi:hypothetical protein [Paraburkholderia sprentiae]|nr:hypothetical protein [Paraburkholderia sprentiae]